MKNKSLALSKFAPCITLIPTDASGRFGMVTVKAVKSLHTPVTLADIKADERLQDMALVRQSRLSVTPVTAKQFAIIMQMAQTKL